MDRLEEVGALLASEEATRDMDSYRKLTREHAELEPVVALYHDFRRTETDLADAQEMLADPDMRDLAEEELEAGKGGSRSLKSVAEGASLPKDPERRAQCVPENPPVQQYWSGAVCGRPVPHVFAFCRA